MKQTVQINELRISFRNLINDKNKKADWLNYKFSSLGVYKITHPAFSRSTKPTALKIDTKKLQFRYVTHKEMFEALLLLPIDMYLRPSKTSVWALRISVHIINPILIMNCKKNECISKA